MPQIRYRSHYIRDIAGVGTREKDQDQKETWVGKLLWRDNFYLLPEWRERFSQVYIIREIIPNPWDIICKAEA